MESIEKCLFKSLIQKPQKVEFQYRKLDKDKIYH